MSEGKSNTESKEIVLVEGKLRKIIHLEGNGEAPSKGQEVEALYRGTLENGTEFDSNQDRENPFKFALGEGSVIKGWDQGFASMTKGERATLICSPEYAYGARGSPPRIPANATLHFEVQLLGFHDKQKQKWQLSTEEKVANAVQSKNAGNESLKNGDFKSAIQSYLSGIEAVDNEGDAAAKQILITLRLNLSQAYLKANKNNDAIEETTKVIKEDPANLKALYRRGLAQIKTQEYQKAEVDFKQLLKHDPSNAEAQKQLVHIATAVKEFRQKEKKIFANIFSKGGLYEDKKIEPEKPKVSEPQKIESEEDEQEILKEEKQEEAQNEPAQVEQSKAEDQIKAE